MDKAVVIIPTYNEIENVENIIRAVMNIPTPHFDILIVDDNSPDGTGEAVKKLQNEFRDRLHLLSRSEKNGLGRAYIAGFHWALENGYGYIIEMDADFSHDPKDLERLYQACASGEMDVAVGSRSQLAHEARADVIFRIQIRAPYNRHPGKRHHRRLRMLPRGRPSRHRLGQHKIRRLRISDRNEIQSLEIRFRHNRSTYHLHRPHGRHIQNEQRHLRGSHFRGHTPQTRFLVQKIPQTPKPASRNRTINRNTILLRC